MINIAINGFGRIGRCFLRALLELGKAKDYKVTQINGTMNAATCKYFFEFDSVHGKFKGNIIENGEELDFGYGPVKITQNRDISQIIWANIDIVIECSGKFNKCLDLQHHLQGGAKKVLVSAPADDVDATIIYGVNHAILEARHRIISVGSCTTNALLPLISIIHNKIGIESGFFTTIHAYTGDQVTVDSNHKDLRRGRAAAVSMIPTSSGASKLLASVFPDLESKIKGAAMRVPVVDVSMIDLKLNLKANTSSAQLQEILKESAAESSGIVGYEERPLVSADFTHTSESSIIDSLETKTITENFIRIAAWYDNEWAFVCRMVDVLGLMKIGINE